MESGRAKSVARGNHGRVSALLGFGLLLLTGCGATKTRTATEQLLMSDAVDRAVAQIDFSPLAGRKVYFDRQYIQNTKDPVFVGNLKGLGYVNADYVISSLRQQLLAAGCRLEESMENADYVVEARLGAVGTDNNEVLFGIPQTNLLSSASALMPNTPPVPAIPEIAIAKRNVLLGAAKVGVFAYNRTTRLPVWQSGMSKATSSARDTWVLGAGPFQQGTIYEGTQFAGAALTLPGTAVFEHVDDHPTPPEEPPRDPSQVTIYDNFTFPEPIMDRDVQLIRPAGFEEPAAARPIQGEPAAGTPPAASANPPSPAPPPAPSGAAPKPKP